MTVRQHNGDNTVMLKGEIKNGVLILNIPVNETPHPSASGKTLVVASTHGNQTLSNVIVDGRPLVVGLNAYIKK